MFNYEIKQKLTQETCRFEGVVACKNWEKEERDCKKEKELFLYNNPPSKTAVVLHWRSNDDHKDILYSDIKTNYPKIKSRSDKYISDNYFDHSTNKIFFLGYIQDFCTSGGVVVYCEFLAEKIEDDWREQRLEIERKTV